ncbi:MAG: VIT domain-containing protein [Coleofasciculus sp. G1-WW12-02]|uniref:VIT domain-containing protein n=1 Tax=Coleofasciculus sp. G1-WW12-02 TaxID=3068483 RepID=UPI0032FEC968
MTPVQSPTPKYNGLYCQSPDGNSLVFPLKHTEVDAKIAGNLSRVEITQRFENPFTQALEAVYVFPLPDEAAVDDMEIKIGDRTIKGTIKKREEAQQIYEQAKQEGRTAGLLEQERDNIFTQSLANIKPGEQIDVTIRYTNSLNFEQGDYEFVFPMVVGPRYIPGTAIDDSGDTDEVPDASRITPPIVPEGMRSADDIGVTVEIDAGVPIQNVHSPSHQLQIETQEEIIRVQLRGDDTIPNKDLILRYQVAGDNTQATVLTQSDQRGGHFALYFIPALDYRPDEIVPKDMVFLMDTSGSQQGAPLHKCQELMRRFINGLNPNDTFTILDFSHTVRHLSQTPLANTPENQTLAINYINQLHASGATEMLSGIRAAINVPAPEGRLRSVVLLSDGYIGNETQILAEVQQELKPGNRLYSFGAGSSVNRFLLNRIAEIGRGICRIIRHDEPTEKVVEKFFRSINNPVLTTIEINWEGTGESPEIYPTVAPDLFAQQPLVLFGRKRDRMAGDLQINGTTADGERYQKTFHLNFSETGNPAIAQLWGRARIKNLMNQMVTYETKSGVEAVTDTALTYQLLCQYTAFVAVSDDVRVEPGSQSVSMNVPVEMAEDVSYRGVFGGTASRRALSIQSKRRPYSARKPNRVLESASISDAFTDEDGFQLIKSYFSSMPEQGNPNQILPTSPSQGSVSKGINEVPKNLGQKPSSPSAKNTQLEVVSVTGLDQTETLSLTQYLQRVNLPSNLSGEIVFEFTLSKGRVGRIMLDEEASTLKMVKVIELIKRNLIKWRPSKAVNSTVVLRLRIQS